MQQFKVQIDDLNATFRDLTIIEWLDLDLEKDSDRLSISIEVAASIVDWCGEGKIDAYALDANPKHHLLIYTIWQKLEELRESPKLKVEQENGKLIVIGKDFYCKMKDLTILQFIDIAGQIRRKNPDESTGYFKCLNIAENLIDWDGRGKLTADELYGDRSTHKYIGAIDVAVTQFFRRSQSPVFEPVAVLDDSNDNGGDDNTKSATMEPPNGKGFKLHANMERV